VILLVSVAWVARITGVSHLCLALCRGVIFLGKSWSNGTF
jgi:hypothetical protein